VSGHAGQATIDQLVVFVNTLLMLAALGCATVCRCLMAERSFITK